MTCSTNIADTFLSLSDSLSKYRRAEIKNENGDSLIENLYVDPLENELILKSMLKNNTTLLLGRKGTGKSTIINRFQHEIRKTNDKLSLYIDVKALFEQTKKSSYTNINNTELKLSKENLDKLSLYVFFIEKIIDELKKEIKASVFQNRFLNFFSNKGITKTQFETELNELFQNIKQPLFKDITAQTKSSQHSSSKSNKTAESELNINLSDQPSIGGKLSHITSAEEYKTEDFTRALGRFFDIIGFMNNLKELLRRIPINHVFICLDDMSEIDKESMEVFTDFIVGPLNNLSDEFFKFKISLYPGRDYLPSIDRQKVTTYCLDYYDLYSIGSADKVEESAIKYTKRLLERRFNYYFNDTDLGVFFDLKQGSSIDDYYKLIFQISSNVPRIIGKVLEIALQKTNSLEKKITKKILQESARQHYKNDIEFVLTKSEYIEYKSYDESFEKFHLLDLLKQFIQKAVENKKHIGTSNAKIFEQYTTNTAPSNYLYVHEDLEEILKTLEFNFFITKFSQQKNKDTETVSVFSLNYGLCIDNNLIFDEKSDRKFRIERVFDFNPVVVNWMKSSKELVCSACGQTYDLSKKEIFIDHKIPCTTCQGNVELRSIIDIDLKRSIESKIQIPMKEYEILNVLKYKNSLTASELGDELDRAYQSINHSIGRKSKINNYKYIERLDGNQPRFKLTSNGLAYLNQ
ncbi:hypothetical protein [Thiomicrorhabdus sediminis]|uniref:Uncharacterized protein n=1 Tax=Thiomicrorhabdus sediminis TaxID=2580412 RepID=A0A4P9K6T1_9GAMM|nr:hypothetical protein [Thiomicrorhabdus sediminis]QCU90036.1 hypothetical protein FE785_05005 [Thiomicrorhabdus sediminis]